MAKLMLLIIVTLGALADAMASSHQEPPLLIDSSPSPSLDAVN